uniref:Transposase Tc1-like domain-containing protein n=1 Tax=Cyprinus carpio TaxID=7962 RepID=A0A8C1PBS8_CYPCA
IRVQRWVAKNPRVTSKQLMAFLVLANESTIRRTLNNHGVQLVSRRLYKKTIAACLQLAKDHVDKPEGYWRKPLYMTDQQLQENLPAVIAAKGGHTRYQKQ